MLFCDKHFEKEFLKIEKWGRIIAIPFFTIMTVFYLTPYPFNVPLNRWLFHLVFSFVGVIAIWYSIRAIIFWFRKKCDKFRIALRLTLQLSISCVTSILIILILHFIMLKYFRYDLICGPTDKFDLKNLLLTSIVVTFLINTIFESLYLFFRFSEKEFETERYKKEYIEAQYQNLTSRLNPHFLFNSLNTLTTIVEEDSKKAVEYIQELSVVYRYVLNTQKSTWTDLPSEIKFTNSYITLLKMRFEENLRVYMDICEKHQTYCILPLTIQLLIENAVKHNEISNTHPLDLTIKCSDEFLVASNNKQKRMIMPSSTKVGLHNISERYRFLVNKDVVIEDTETTFTVKIPLVKITS